MYRVVAFDAYGTLFDVYSITELAEELFPGQGQALAVMWRDRQVDYTRLVTLSDPSPTGSRHYVSFWDLTVLSLRYVCKRLGLTLHAEAEGRLMGQYAGLKAFDDAAEVLGILKGRGLATAILSNGNASMLLEVLRSNGLSEAIDRVVSVEAARLFKTAPQAYELLLKEFPVKKSEILFVSSNAWDALAAKWFGFDVFWVNRASQPFEEIGQPPDYEGTCLLDVLQAC